MMQGPRFCTSVHIDMMALQVWVSAKLFDAFVSADHDIPSKGPACPLLTRQQLLNDLYLGPNCQACRSPKVVKVSAVMPMR